MSESLKAPLVKNANQMCIITELHAMTAAQLGQLSLLAKNPVIEEQGDFVEASKREDLES